MLKIIHMLTFLKKFMKKNTKFKVPKFKVADHVKISKYKDIFAKGNTPNWSEEDFVIKEVENTAPSTYVINDLNGENHY